MGPSRPHKTDADKKKRRKARRRELERLVRSLETENRRLKEDSSQHSVTQTKRSSTVPRPRGSTGDGFNLREAMGLYNNPRLYKSIQRTVRDVVSNAGLNHRTVWRRQPKETIVKLFRVARKRQPYLRRFVNDWATEEFAKQYLKNRRAYCRRKGLDEDIDLDPDGGDEDDDGGELRHIDDFGTALDDPADDPMGEGAGPGGSDDDYEEEDKGEGPSGTTHDDDDD